MWRRKKNKLHPEVCFGNNLLFFRSEFLPGDRKKEPIWSLCTLPESMLGSWQGGDILGDSMPPSVCACNLPIGLIYLLRIDCHGFLALFEASSLLLPSGTFLLCYSFYWADRGGSWWARGESQYLSSWEKLPLITRTNGMDMCGEKNGFYKSKLEFLSSFFHFFNFCHSLPKALRVFCWVFDFVGMCKVQFEYCDNLWALLLWHKSRGWGLVKGVWGVKLGFWQGCPSSSSSCSTFWSWSHTSMIVVNWANFWGSSSSAQVEEEEKKWDTWNDE